MKKTLMALLAGLVVAGTLAASVDTADARWRRGPGWGAGAVIGGLAAGAIIGSAIANNPPPPPGAYYYDPGPAYVVEEPACRIVRERYWDGYGWRRRNVQVCD